MARMPSWSRSINVWRKYLLEESMSVDDAIEKTTSVAVAGWLQENRSQINVVDFETTSSAEIISTEDAEAVLSTSHEPDSDEQPSEFQRGTKV